jgi:Tol biopolymer transport system component
MNADGTGQTRATTSAACDYGPAWSPDGKRIAFASDADWYNSLYEPEIWVMDADGTDLTRLTDDAAADFGPAWRP